jgi:predicted N-acetyltransferase YhbS
VVEVRTARESELEQIIALQVERNGAECDPMIRALAADPDVGIERFSVAVDSGQVVSSIALMAQTFRLGGVSIPIGQPEFVATAVGQERRGLIRRQMDLLHAWSAERGDLTQIIAGIPYFYRRFGYEYAIGMPPFRLLMPGVRPEMRQGWTVRDALPDDAGAITSLNSERQRAIPLTCSRSERWWRWWIGPHGPGQVCVAERAADIRGAAWIGDGPTSMGGAVTALMHVAAADDDAIRALLAHAVSLGRPVVIEERWGVTPLLDPVTVRHPRAYALYVRVADPVRLLDRMRPVLSDRLRRSLLRGSCGRLLLSQYTSSILLSYADGEVVSVEAGPGEQNPVEKGGAGVPPDLMATLIYGRYGARELDARHDDVRLGAAAPVMDILFPRVEADIVTSL